MKKTLRPKSNRKRKRKHGFRRRMATKKGRATVRNKRRKGKRVLSA